LLCGIGGGAFVSGLLFTLVKVLDAAAGAGADDDTGPMAMIFLGMIAAVLVGTGALMGCILGSVFGSFRQGRTRRTFWQALGRGLATVVVSGTVSVLLWWVYMTRFFNFKTEGLMGPMMEWVLNAMAVMTLGTVVAIVQDAGLSRRGASN